MGIFGERHRRAAEAADAVTTDARQNAEALTKVVTALQRAASPAQAAQLALDAVRQSFGWVYGSYWRIDPEENVLRFSVESGDAGPEFRQVTQTRSPVRHTFSFSFDT